MKTLLVLLFFFLTAHSAFPQLDPYNWRVGISGGYTNYYGDLSPHKISSVDDFSNLLRLFNYNENYVTDYSYTLSLERTLNATLGLQLSVGKYSISMTDRYISPSNVLQLDSPNFMRSLNFKTEITDYGVGLVIKADNGKLLKKNAFIAPYLTLGVGWLNFKVFGDLYDDENNPYDYSRPENVNNDIFETRLDRLNTEIYEGYSNTAFYGQFGLGIRFRVARQLELFAQSDFKLTNTDYLDDVSGGYRQEYDSPQQLYTARPNPEWDYSMRGSDNGRNDWYINHSVGIKLSLSPRKSAFTASRVTPGYYGQTDITPANLGQTVEPTDSLSTSDKQEPITNNYITFIQLNQPYNRDSSYYSFKVLEADVSILSLENRLIANSNSTESLNTVLDSLQTLRTEATSDTIAPSPALLQSIDDQINTANGQLDNVLVERTAIEEELRAARQNKELFYSAYNLSLEKRETTDSLAFMNKILELPAAVKSALAYQGTYYTIGQDTLGTAEMPAPYQSSEAGRPASRFGENSSTLNSPSQIGAGYDNQLYSALLQERARNNDLLNELRNYDQTYRINEPIYAEGEDKWQNYDRERRRSSYDNPYIINGMSEMARSRNNTPYVVPIIVPRNNQREDASQQAMTSEEVHQRNIPQQLKINPRLNRPISSIFNSQYPSPLRRDGITVPTLPEDRNRQTVVDETPSNIAGNPFIISKVDVYFGNNQANPEDEELKKLLPLIEFVKSNPDVRLTVSGFADNTGPLQYNLNLVKKRIAQVQNFLTEQNGISTERVNVQSGGLIVRESGRRPSPSDRKVEVWMHESNE